MPSPANHLSLNPSHSCNSSSPLHQNLYQHYTCQHHKVSSTLSKVTAQYALGQSFVCFTVKMQLLLQTGFTKTSFVIGAHSGKLLLTMGVPSWPLWLILNCVIKFNTFTSVVAILGLMVLWNEHIWMSNKHCSRQQMELKINGCKLHTQYSGQNELQSGVTWGALPIMQ